MTSQCHVSVFAFPAFGPSPKHNTAASTKARNSHWCVCEDFIVKSCAICYPAVAELRLWRIGAKCLPNRSTCARHDRLGCDKDSATICVSCGPITLCFDPQKYRGVGLALERASAGLNGHGMLLLCSVEQCKVPSTHKEPV